MARLGSLLGGILAELARGQAISDQLTRDLVAEYQDDPVLSTLPIPRVTINDVDLTLRFTVDDVEEPAPTEVNLDDLRQRIGREDGEKLLASILSEFKLDRSEQASILAAIKESGGRLVNLPTVASLKSALAGNSSRAVDMIVKPAFDVWEKIPAALRRKIGNKDLYSLTLKRHVTARLETIIKNARSAADAKTALGSKINVAVTRDTLPDDPGKVQELRLTLRSGDLDLIVSQSEERVTDGD